MVKTARYALHVIHKNEFPAWICHENYEGFHGAGRTAKECGMAQTEASKMELGSLTEEQKIPLESLSTLTGFPVDFIKKELLLDDDQLSLAELRRSMLTYLESHSEMLQG